MLGRSDRGTVLLLMPAAVFVMLVLGAIVLDVGLSRVRAQELRSVAASAANDSLGALDVDELRSSGTIVISEARAEVLAAESVAQGPLPNATIEDVCRGPRPTRALGNRCAGRLGCRAGDCAGAPRSARIAARDRH